MNIHFRKKLFIISKSYFKCIHFISITNKAVLSLAGLVAGVNNITYDYTNKRLALRGLVFHRGQHRLFDMIADYKKKKVTRELPVSQRHLREIVNVTRVS